MLCKNNYNDLTANQPAEFRVV